MRVVALAPYPLQAPSTRFRLGQFIRPLAAAGIHLRILPFFSEAEFQTLYRPGGRAKKAGLLLRGIRRRTRQMDLAERADLVLVHRELAPLASGPLLARLRSADLPMAFDFDDAVFLHPKGGNPFLRRVRSPQASTAALCQSADLILAGNDYLADFARKTRKGPQAVRVLPTVIDTDRFRPVRVQGPRQPLVVGWIGTHSTLCYLKSTYPSLKQLAARIPFQLLVVSNRRPDPAPGLNLNFLPWSEKTEREALKAMHVGIYPLPEDPWTLGKCGFKAIQYMAFGVPVVASPVGVLKEVVVDGETGFHASTEGDWVSALERILTDPGTRKKFGAAGRERAVLRYSLGATVPTLVDWLDGCRRRWLEGRGKGERE